MGRRLGPVTASVPKPMLPVAGRPFLDWIILFLYAQGLRHIIVSAGYLAHIISDHLKTIARAGLLVECVTEASPLGTGGAFRHVTATADRKPVGWLVLNGDSLTVTPLAPLWACLAGPDASGAILAVETTDRGRYGSLERNAQGDLLSFGEKRSDGAGLINAGVYLLRPSLVSTLPPAEPSSLECDAFPHWLGRGERLKVHACSAPFLDIGTPESLARAADFIALHKKTILQA
jgi:D-glycero-alpha-D-manno-heptose 1-phosphate guanylyltransferase